MRPRPAKKQSGSDRLRRMLPGVDRVVSFFQSAGVTAELTRDGCLKVNGGQTRPLTQVLPPAGTFDWDEVIDEMALRFASHKFVNAIARYGRFSGGRALLLRGDLGFVIMRGHPWPGNLEPIGRWTSYSGSFVAGHRRRLNDGQTASNEACDRARQVGITLRSRETWVRPHARGIPDGLEMRFRWNAPEELGRVVRKLD